MRDLDPGAIRWRRPPFRYLVLYLDGVTTPVVALILGLALLGLRSLLFPA